MIELKPPFNIENSAASVSVAPSSSAISYEYPAPCINAICAFGFFAVCFMTDLAMSTYLLKSVLFAMNAAFSIPSFAIPALDIPPVIIAIASVGSADATTVPYLFRFSAVLLPEAFCA